MEFGYEFADLGVDEVAKLRELEEDLERTLGRKVNLVAYSPRDEVEHAGTEGRRARHL